MHTYHKVSRIQAKRFKNRAMDITVYFDPSIPHHKEWGEAFVQGLRRHNVNHMHVSAYNNARKTDLAVFWSHHRKQIIHKQFHNEKDYLCLERGYIDRMNFASASLNGLHGLSEDYVYKHDNVRILKHGWRAKKYKRNDGPIVIMGQVPGDASLWGLNIHGWARAKAQELIQYHDDVLFKPHPHDKSDITKKPCRITRAPIEEVLRTAKWVVTYTSTAGIDAVMEGVPAIADGEGSMIYDLHEYKSKEDWLRWLSYRQWSREEYKNGDFWDYFYAYYKNR